MNTELKNTRAEIDVILTGMSYEQLQTTKSILIVLVTQAFVDFVDFV